VGGFRTPTLGPCPASPFSRTEPRPVGAPWSREPRQRAAEAECGLAGFQEEARTGRRQQGAGSLAACRVRGRALPPLRVDAGEDAERLPSSAGEAGGVKDGSQRGRDALSFGKEEGMGG
jgi:hypothetical protein